jgi:hypothetical protein
MPELAAVRVDSKLATTAKSIADVDPLAARLAHWLDGAFRVPGTNLRFGLDAVLGMIAPGAGDLATGGLGTYLFFVALRRGVPLAIIARMAINVIIDTFVGSVPVLGDLFDFAWKANQKNLELIRKHAGERGPPGFLDYLVILLFAGGVLASVVIAFGLAATIFGWGIASLFSGST